MYYVPCWFRMFKFVFVLDAMSTRLVLSRWRRNLHPSFTWVLFALAVFGNISVPIRHIQRSRHVKLYPMPSRIPMPYCFTCSFSLRNRNLQHRWCIFMRIMPSWICLSVYVNRAYPQKLRMPNWILLSSWCYFIHPLSCWNLWCYFRRYFTIAGLSTMSSWLRM